MNMMNLRAEPRLNKMLFIKVKAHYIVKMKILKECLLIRKQKIVKLFLIPNTYWHNMKTNSRLQAKKSKDLTLY